jgi:hypothetical protein
MGLMPKPTASRHCALWREQESLMIFFFWYKVVPTSKFFDEETG